MVNMNKYSFGANPSAATNTQATATSEKKPPVLASKTVVVEPKPSAPKPQPSKPVKQDDVFVQQSKKTKQPPQNFWQRNLAAIVGITSLGFLASIIIGGIATHRARKTPPSLDIPLTYKDVFTNYRDNKLIPTLEQLPGMTKVKQSFLDNIINPKRNSAIYGYWGAEKANGVLLHGPAGTGKSFITKVLAKELDAEVAEISVQNEGSAYVNQAARNIGNKFDFICQSAEKHPDKEFVIIMEEIDGLGQARGGSHENTSHREVVTTLLASFDKAQKHKNITIVANTNDFEGLDGPLKDRLKLPIPIHNPEPDEIRAALTYHLEKSKSKAAEGFDVDSVVQGLNGFSHRKIEQIVQVALSKGASEQMKDSTKNKLTVEHFEQALQAFKNGEVDEHLNPDELQQLRNLFELGAKSGEKAGAKAGEESEEDIFTQGFAELANAGRNFLGEIFGGFEQLGDVLERHTEALEGLQIYGEVAPRTVSKSSKTKTLAKTKTTTTPPKPKKSLPTDFAKASKLGNFFSSPTVDFGHLPKEFSTNLSNPEIQACCRSYFNKSRTDGEIVDFAKSFLTAKRTSSQESSQFLTALRCSKEYRKTLTEAQKSEISKVYADLFPVS